MLQYFLRIHRNLFGWLELWYSTQSRLKFPSVIVIRTLLLCFKRKLLGFRVDWVVLYKVTFSVQFLLTPQALTLHSCHQARQDFSSKDSLLVLLILSIWFAMDTNQFFWFFETTTLLRKGFDICILGRPYKSLNKIMSSCSQVWNICDIFNIHY